MPQNGRLHQTLAWTQAIIWLMNVFSYYKQGWRLISYCLAYNIFDILISNELVSSYLMTSGLFVVWIEPKRTKNPALRRPGVRKHPFNFHSFCVLFSALHFSGATVLFFWALFSREGKTNAADRNTWHVCVLSNSPVILNHFPTSLESHSQADPDHISHCLKTVPWRKCTRVWCAA